MDIEIEEAGRGMDRDGGGDLFGCMKGVWGIEEGEVSSMQRRSSGEDGDATWEKGDFRL